jgi:hypothetical protein
MVQNIEFFFELFGPINKFRRNKEKSNFKKKEKILINEFFLQNFTFALVKDVCFGFGLLFFFLTLFIFISARSYTLYS